jgi:hypothetical protein
MVRRNASLGEPTKMNAPPIVKQLEIVKGLRSGLLLRAVITMMDDLVFQGTDIPNGLKTISSPQLF